MKKLLLIQFYINPQICCRMIHILAIEIKNIDKYCSYSREIENTKHDFLLYTCINYLEKSNLFYVLFMMETKVSFIACKQI